MDPAATTNRLALDNRGVFTTSTAATYGLSRRQIAGLVERAVMVPIHRGVYRLTGTEPTFDIRCRAAALAGGADAAIDRLAAAALHELRPFEDDRLISIAAPGARGHCLVGVEAVRRTALSAKDLTRIRGITVTTATRTIIDCAGELSTRSLGALLDEALRTKRTALPLMRSEAARLRSRGRAGSGRMTEVLDERWGEVRPSNAFERQVSGLLVANGLPAPIRQHEVVLPSGRSRFLDLAYPKVLIGLEPAGWRWHVTREQWAADLGRNNELTGVGWRIIPISWELLTHRPAVLIRDVRGALDRAGGSPIPRTSAS